MPIKIVVPTIGRQGLNDNLAQHFGRAPYFTAVDLDDNGEVTNVKAVPNAGEHAGGVGHAHDNILDLKPNVIIVYGMGPRGLNTFQNAGISVLRTNADIVKEVVAAYKNSMLQVLTDGCADAHHQ
jgi:predicted Fe-Mo cluster-binding NifX family protein